MDSGAHGSPEEQIARPSSRLSSLVSATAGALFIITLLMLPLLAGTADISLRILVIVIAMACVFFVTLGMIYNLQLSLPFGAAIVGGLLVLAAGILSTVKTDNPQAAILTLINWLGYGTAFFLGWWTGRNFGDRRNIIRAVFALAVAMALYAVVQHTILLDQVLLEVQSDKAGTLMRLGFSEQEYEPLLARITSKRAYGTFALPNTLAGYFLCLIPLCFALLVSARNRIQKYILGACSLIMLCGLFVTFSKGGWLAAVITAIIFFATFGRTWLLRNWRRFIAILLTGVILVLGAVLFSPTVRGRLSVIPAELAATAKVRSEYWSAAFGMWREKPLLGVGPGNFQNHYLRHKTITAEETKSAHNDFVQLLSEAGPLALAGYALFWAMLLAAVARSTNRATEQNVRVLPSPLIPIAGLTGIAAAAFLGLSLAVFIGIESNVLFALGFLGVWLIVYLISDTPIQSRHLQIGILFGLLAYILHSFVDMHFYVDGLAFTAFALAGLAAPATLPEFKLRLSMRWQFPALVLASVIAVVVFYGATRVSNAAAYRANGVILARENADALAVLRAACAADPLDHESWATLGAYSARQFAQTADVDHLVRAVAALQKAISLNPSYAEYHSQLAQFFLDVSRRRPQLLKQFAGNYSYITKTLSLSVAPDYALPAIAEAYQVTVLAPTRPQSYVLLGDACMFGAQGVLARRQFEHALALNAAMQAGGAPKRQWLSPDEDARVQKTLGLTPPSGSAIIPK